MASVIADPVHLVMRGDQKLVSDPTYSKTKINFEITEKQTRTDLYNIQMITCKLPSYVSMETLVLSIPMQINLYLDSETGVSPITEQFNQWLWSDMCNLNAFYEIIIKVNNERLDNEEQSKIRNIKTIITDCKYDKDDYAYLGQWGIPYSQTVSRERSSQTTYAINQTPIEWYRPFESQLRSVSEMYNGTVSKTFIPVEFAKVRNLDKYTLKTQLTLPLRYINQAFRCGGRLPPNTIITIEVKSYNTPQFTGAKAIGEVDPTLGFAAYGTVYATTLNQGMRLFYLYDFLNPTADHVITEYRKTEPLSFTTELMDEFIIGGDRGVNIIETINLQQQFPNEILIKTISTALFTDGYVVIGSNFNESNQSAFKPILIPIYFVCFKDSICSLIKETNDTPIIPFTYMKTLRLYDSGDEIINQFVDASTTVGSLIGTAQDYLINMVLNKNSHLRDNNMRYLNKPVKNFNAALCNATQSILILPGEETNLGMECDDYNGRVLRLEIELNERINKSLSIVVYRKTAALWLMDGSTVKLMRWPNLRNDTPCLSA